MANFSITNSTFSGAGANAQQALATTYKTLLVTYATTGGGGTNAGALRRGKIYDILIGTNGTPADNTVEYRMVRTTTAAGLTGSISSLSSTFGIDLADNTGYSAGSAANLTAETSNTAVVDAWYVGVNQRASYRWVAAPGSELIFPANSSATGQNGLALQAKSIQGYTGTATGNILWQEL